MNDVAIPSGHGAADPVRARVRDLAEITTQTDTRDDLARATVAMPTPRH